ncbi:hypothetical protein DA391_03680 [Yersinia massiliensis]|jgi:hypothetical protein|uniref:Uncharacterized protein n=1 Tax=Yersinia massiliensis TaxID=419257 RepID=A0ABM6UPE9_9GAMM|nr:hypothetical protein CRN74_15515 [Yersinia frederiksenii]AVX36835.1 hypothetical protein DA391_03680 [Yersinia massiliensis]
MKDITKKYILSDQYIHQSINLKNNKLVGVVFMALKSRLIMFYSIKDRAIKKPDYKNAVLV